MTRVPTTSVETTVNSKIETTIRRIVRVNRARKPQKAIVATGCSQYCWAYNGDAKLTNSKVINAMSRGEGEEVEVIFFNLGCYVNDLNLAEAYQLRGFKPADPYSLMAVNEMEPDFVKTIPNTTHWKDSNGKYCYIAFRLYMGDRVVNAQYSDNGGFRHFWWFAGLRR